MAVLTPHEAFGDLVTTTFRHQSTKIADAISKHNAVFRKLEPKKVRVSGGTTICHPLDYQENSTYQRYSGYDTLNMNASPHLTNAEFNWRSVAVSVVASGQELRINNSKEQIINLVKSRTKNAQRTFANNFSMDMMSDGTLPNQINGIRALISDSGLGTVGNINAANWEFWRNKVQTANASLHGINYTLSKDNIDQVMLELYMACTRGDDAPDLILADTILYAMFENSQLPLRRYTSKEATGQSGFTALKYKGADVLWDTVNMPSNRMYFLNTEYLDLVVHPDADMTPLPNVRPHNQDASVTSMIWMGNMVCSNRMLQGVLKPS